MEGYNLYLGIPVGTWCCFLFLMFSFLNTEKSKAVRYFQMILATCLLWTGGAVLMRMQLYPGIAFWFNVSLLGLLLMPVCIYFFLFFVLNIRRYYFLIAVTVITCIVVVCNGIFGMMISPPRIVMREADTIAFTYTLENGVYVLLAAEVVAFVYVIVIAHKKIAGNRAIKWRLMPLWLGALFVLAGNMLELMPGNIFPYDTLGGLLMACCFAHIMYKQYLFDVSHRITIGVIYTMALVIAFLPIGSITAQSESIMKNLGSIDKFFPMITVVLMVWGIFVFGIAFHLAERMLERKKQEQLEKLKIFQRDTASLFEEEKLYGKIIKAVRQLNENADVYIFVKKEEEAEFEIVSKSEHCAEMTETEKREVISSLYAQDLNEHPEISLLKCDGVIYGFIYLNVKSKIKMNYIEEECYRQIGAYASICLKNINIYQKVYQVSIHDELTGLYNRFYYKEYIEKAWNHKKIQSIIYMDLDDFKLLNELYGEACGDAILTWCGQKIKGTVGERGATFRMGSNEFLVFVHDMEKEQLLRLAEEIRESIAVTEAEKPRVLQPITFSMGIAVYPENASNADELLRQAKKTVFFAKRNGKNRVELYEVGVESAKNEDTVTKRYEEILPTIYALTAAIDAKDSFTFEHSCQVSEYAVLLARETGLNTNEVQMVKEAGLLHDIGKIGIPEHILKKQGKLTAEEYDIMKTHVENSIEMIHFLPNMDYVIPAVMSHHERYDGNGYPRGLAGEEIPLLGRILAICDSFDAMLSKRSYKEPMPIEYAMAELERNKGSQFDPKLAETFIKLVSEKKIEGADFPD